MPAGLIFWALGRPHSVEGLGPSQAHIASAKSWGYGRQRIRHPRHEGLFLYKGCSDCFPPPLEQEYQIQ